MVVITVVFQEYHPGAGKIGHLGVVEFVHPFRQPGDRAVSGLSDVEVEDLFPARLAAAGAVANVLLNFDEAVMKR